MRERQKAKVQTMAPLMAAVLSGMLVAVIARLLVGVLLAAVYAIVPVYCGRHAHPRGRYSPRLTLPL